MKLLITNDDGWNAPGIRSLANAAAAFGEVWIVAPADHMSGISHQVTWERPLELCERADRLFSLDGTPADCVRIGTTQLGIQFDWVLSGVNNGANLGTDIYVSGTVAATREAVLQGFRSLALSQHRLDITGKFDWKVTEAFVSRVLPKFLGSAPELQCRAGININFPDVPMDAVTQVGLVRCELDRKPLPLKFRKCESGLFHSSAIYNQRERSAGKDIEACFGGKISLTEIDL